MAKELEKFHNLVESLEKLPSVGKKTAQRFAYHLLMSDTFFAVKLASDIVNQ